MHELVLVIADESEVPLNDQEGFLTALMEPYSESLEVPEYESVVQPAEKIGDFWAIKSLVEEGALPTKDTYTAAEVVTAYKARWGDEETLYVNERGDICERSTFNPVAQWDWWQLGGRWSGQLKVKPGRVIFDEDHDRTYETGERSWANEDEELPEGRVDTALIRDIDLVTEFDAAYARTLEVYDTYSDAIAPHWPILGWRQYLQQGEAEGHSIDELRATYKTYASKAEAAMKDAGLMSGWGSDPITLFGEPHNAERRHLVARRAALNAVVPGNVLFESDGWHESSAGIWSSLEEDQEKDEAFSREMWERILALPETARVWAVDIHS